MWLKCYKMQPGYLFHNSLAFFGTEVVEIVYKPVDDGIFHFPSFFQDKRGGGAQARCAGGYRLPDVFVSG